MRKKLNFVLDCLEKAADILDVVVDAGKKIMSIVKD